ncbi:hypothetical protein SAMD00019534_036160 [Acytostelium subglobosum LB1]|uniref:hypothetical protein n=1 Tax=Acytostelium subglobosum LB1 TaxID=1410327 RepID=UPI000644929D|nr:hypothetical protein SAMD00019534_036160 [Acytostelium subglobosum LB1]GAM20441.1 hypothetical protein SAMD00019534_036160 [Acytostelium subglobosum LB1]|eukprot:XP_012759962.1 hypothetical protein SAMD00019534_036160 [Acytostelium subglobosum LB1]
MIFACVKTIHRSLGEHQTKYVWKEIRQSPTLLALFGQLDHLKQSCLEQEQRYSKYRWSEIDGAPFAPNLQQIVKQAIIGGHLNILEWAYQRYYPHVHELFDGLANHAIDKGHVHIVRYLGHTLPAGHKAFHNLPTSSHMYEISSDMLQCLIHEVFRIPLPYQHNIPERLKRLLNLNERCCTNVISSLSLWCCKSLELIKYLHTNGLPIMKETVNAAAKANELEVFRYLEIECKLGKHIKAAAMDIAAGAGSLKIVRYLHENRNEGCSEYALSDAATQGHLDVVRYLQEKRGNKCNLEVALERAIIHGHLSIVEYLHRLTPNGCRHWMFKSAAEAGHHQVVKFLCDNQSNDQIRYASSDLLLIDSPLVLDILDRRLPNMVWPRYILSQAFKQRKIDIIDYLVNNQQQHLGKWVDLKVIGKSMRLEDPSYFFKLVQYLPGGEYALSETFSLIQMAPFCQHRTILDYVYKESIKYNCSFTLPTFIRYIRGGRMAKVELESLHYFNVKGDLKSKSHELFESALDSNRMDIVLYVVDTFEYSIFRRADVFDKAIISGSVETLCRFISRNEGQLPWTYTLYSDAVNDSILKGNKKMIRFLAGTPHCYKVEFEAQHSFNTYMSKKHTDIDRDPNKVARFIDYMLKNHEIEAQQSWFKHGDLFNLDATISLWEAGCTTYDLGVAFNGLKQQHTDVLRFVHFNFPKEMILSDQTTPFISKRLSYMFERMEKHPVSNDLVNKFLIKDDKQKVSNKVLSVSH